MKHLIDLRHTLHQHPELSGKEYNTRKVIRNFIQASNPDEIIEIGKTGIAFCFNGRLPGKTLLFRAELDALPIVEKNNIAHVSSIPGVAHLCGHDGHMTILAGLAERIANNPPKRGSVILLFQPAEETGEGALEMIESSEFQSIEVDYIFALHNIPGEEMNSVMVKEGSFCAASKGMTLILEGKTAHAGEPEKAINPANALSRIIEAVNLINTKKRKNNIMAFATIIHLQLGEIAFGTSPGYAEIRMTLRANEDKDLEQLCREVEEQIDEITQMEGLKQKTSYSEIFPAVKNDSKALELVIAACKENGMQLKNLKEAYRWSEDFGYYSQKTPSAFFGLGSGKTQAALHHPDFDFPDELLPNGIAIFYSIYNQLLN